MSDTTQNNNTTNNENNSSLTAVEIAKNAVEQMYNLAMGAVSTGSALIDNKIASTTMTFWSGGVDLFKNQVTNQNDNHYQGIGRAVGDMLNLAITFGVQKKVESYKVKGEIKAGAAFITYIGLAELNLGEKFSNLFNTYVANADRFYDEIITNDDFFNKVKNGLINNGLMNFVDYFDPDGDGNVSAVDIVNGYQKLFSPPPAFGTMDFEIQFASNKPKEIIIKADISKQEEEKEIIQAVMKHDEIQTLTINSQTYNIKELSNLELRNAIDYIPKVSFLLSNILIKAEETIDLGTKGLYKVKSGDTLSTIAQNNKLITKDLLKLNPHLIDNLNISKYKRTLTYTHKWQGNEEKEEDKKFTISGSVVKSSQGLKVKEIISGNSTIIDDDRDDDPEDVDPIIIDLNKNKITSTKLNNTTYFDHDNNNFKEATSWIDKGDAFLALDKNSNGLIDNGNELFGNHTISNTKYGEKEANNKDTSINGYEALKAYDLNGDNVIDSKDEIYDKLLLWKDSNQNAITDKGSITIANDVWFK